MSHPALIDRAASVLKALDLDVLVLDAPKQGKQCQADALMRVGKGKGQIEYAVEVKRSLVASTLGAATMQLRQMTTDASPALLLTDYLTPPMAASLREQKQQFVDAAGNAYLQGPGLMVYVTGRKPLEKRVAPHAGKAHTLTGLKVMFTLLCTPELADAPQRAIAAAAGVALGSIPAVLADMQQAGHLRVLAKRRQLNATRRLLDEWALAYARRLRAQTLQAIYMVHDLQTWKTWLLDAPHAQWGGEPAATLLVGHLVPGVHTIYANKLPPRLLVEQKMVAARNVQSGDPVLEWRKPFWGLMPFEGRNDTVHPVLVYADLLATGDARCIETAQLVYDQYLARLLPSA
jgi:hypothetical protein